MMQGAECGTCGGWRLHRVAAHRHGRGKGARVTRRRVCTACGTATELAPAEQPGLCCPRCANVAVRTWMVRPRYKTRTAVVAPGLSALVRVPVVLRVHLCGWRECRHRFRTVQLLETAFA